MSLSAGDSDDTGCPDLPEMTECRCCPVMVAVHLIEPCCRTENAGATTLPKSPTK